MRYRVIRATEDRSGREVWAVVDTAFNRQGQARRQGEEPRIMDVCGLKADAEESARCFGLAGVVIS